MKKSVRLNGGAFRRNLRRISAVGLCGAMLLTVVPGPMAVMAAEDEVTTEPDTEVTEPDTEVTEPDTEVTEPVAKSQTIKVKTASKTYAQNTIRMNGKSFQIGASAKTALSYKVLSGGKYISVSKKGVVTIKKGLPCGTYKIRVTAAATEKYKKATKDVKITVKKSTPVMSKLPIKWDLKNNKKVTCQYYVNPSIYKNGSVTIKDVKTTKGKKNNKVTFTVQWDRPNSLAKTEVARIRDSFTGYGFGYYYSVVDYQTGECLEGENAYGVKVKAGKWKESNEKTFSDGSWWFSYPTKVTVKVTITYPKTYKDLCVVAGGQGDPDKANQFYDGKITFDKTNGVLYSKSHKNLCHAIRFK